MTNVIAAPSPQTIIQRVDWQKLVKAHLLIRQCSIVQGIQQYKRLLLNQFARYFYERRWGYSDDPTEPSLNWACVYLTEYYMRECVWADWIDLYKLILPDEHRFSPLCRSRLTATYGWAQLEHSASSLDAILREQQYALDSWAMTTEAAAHHYLVIGIIYRRQRRLEEAEKAFRQAMVYFSPEADPFYAVTARDYLAGMYAAYQSKNPGYTEMAQTLYQEIQDIISNHGDAAETEAQHYGRGWYHLEKPNLQLEDKQQALTWFDMGEKIMGKYGLVFEQHLNRYGKSAAYLYLGDYDAAIAEARAALKVFWSNGCDLLPTVLSHSPVSITYTAVCLKLLAHIYEEKQDYLTALEYALRALKWHDYFDLPVERSFLYQTLARLYKHLGQDEKSRRWSGNGQT